MSMPSSAVTDQSSGGVIELVLGGDTMSPADRGTRCTALDGLPVSNGDPAAGLEFASTESWSGGFAFALADRKKRILHAYRDHYGARPLYYALDGRRLILSSEIPLLLHRLAAKPAIDEVAVMEYLSCGNLSENRTFHRGVKRVPAASRLTAQAGRIQVERYWGPWPDPRGAARGGADLADEFRSLFRTAVRDTLSDEPPAAVLLSGGPDSSAVLGMAAEVVREDGARPPASLAALTMVFDQVKECDESLAARETAALHGLPWREVSVEAFSPLHGLDAFLDRFGEPPCSVNLALETRLLEAASEAGVTVLLDGHDADALFTPSGEYLSNLALHLRWPRLVSEMIALRRIHRYPLPRLLRHAVAPLVPRCLKPPRRRVRPWLRAEAALRTDLELRLRPAKTGACFAEREAERALNPGVGLALEVTRCLERMHGIEGRHPFFNPHLVRFLLSIPIEERFRKGETKILLRRSLSHLITGAARRRIHKTNYTAYFCWSLREHLGDLIERLIERGSPYLDPYIDWRHARVMLRSFLDGAETERVAVWRMLVLDRWLMTMDKSLEGGAGA